MDRFLLSHTIKVERSDSKPRENERERESECVQRNTQRELRSAKATCLSAWDSPLLFKGTVHSLFLPLLHGDKLSANSPPTPPHPAPASSHTVQGESGRKHPPSHPSSRDPDTRLTGKHGAVCAHFTHPWARAMTISKNDAGGTRL